ncbi:MAG: GNAT family N-acetyltransferase [Cyanobacteria bacterium Co-bin8]|nr:GNAT family N-acetyltransferase [Cyanobacteria bacterium Co-bin8]
MSSASNVEIQAATPADVPVIFELIKALAEYEKLAHEVVGTAEDLHQHLFGERPYIEAVVARVEGEAAGFALFFHNYSTFLTRPGIYLEDLFVLPQYRRQGVGKALLLYLGKLALSRGCGRLEWNVLDWNESAIAFYERMGAELQHDWRLCRVSEKALKAFEEP